jgi:hypothetical protein
LENLVTHCEAELMSIIPSMEKETYSEYFGEFVDRAFKKHA